MVACTYEYAKEKEKNMTFQQNIMLLKYNRDYLTKKAASDKLHVCLV